MGCPTGFVLDLGINLNLAIRLKVRDHEVGLTGVNWGATVNHWISNIPTDPNLASVANFRSLILLIYTLLKYSGKNGTMVTQTLSRSGVMYTPMKAARQENSMR